MSPPPGNTTAHPWPWGAYLGVGLYTLDVGDGQARSHSRGLAMIKSANGRRPDKGHTKVGGVMRKAPEPSQAGPGPYKGIKSAHPSAASVRKQSRTRTSGKCESLSGPAASDYRAHGAHTGGTRRTDNVGHWCTPRRCCGWRGSSPHNSGNPRGYPTTWTGGGG